MELLLVVRRTELIFVGLMMELMMEFNGVEGENNFRLSTQIGQVKMMGEEEEDPPTAEEDENDKHFK